MLIHVRSSDLPTPDDMARTLAARLPGFQDTAWVADTGSTNADLLARARAQSDREKPWLLGTHLQNNGRGRAGRPWQNQAGSTLMFSCAFDVYLPAVELPTLSPLAGLTACEALRSLAGPLAPGLVMKWPNDIQWQQGKLAGVLVETFKNPGRDATGYSVIIGIGINLNDADALSQALDRQISDWSQLGRDDAQVSAADLVCATATAWHAAICELEAHGFQAFRTRFDQVDALAGCAVNVLDQGATLLSGTACGVDGQGRLLLRTAQGITTVNVGEISVRPQS